VHFVCLPDPTTTTTTTTHTRWSLALELTLYCFMLVSFRYRAESENVVGRYFCSMPDSWYHSMVSNGGNGNNGFIPNTMEGCMALNRPTSAMMSFLATQENTFTQSQMALVQTEVARCETQMMEFATLCPNPADVSNANCPAAVQFFNNNANWISDTQLMTACPQCNGTDLPHPYVLHPPTCRQTREGVLLVRELRARDTHTHGHTHTHTHTHTVFACVFTH